MPEDTCAGTVQVHPRRMANRRQAERHGATPSVLSGRCRFLERVDEHDVPHSAAVGELWSLGSSRMDRCSRRLSPIHARRAASSQGWNLEYGEPFFPGMSVGRRLIRRISELMDRQPRIWFPVLPRTKNGPPMDQVCSGFRGPVSSASESTPRGADAKSVFRSPRSSSLPRIGYKARLRSWVTCSCLVSCASKSRIRQYGT